MACCDANLVRAVLDGDRSAYAGLYDRHAPLIRAICHDATGDLASAQDLAQEVFVRAYCRLGTLRDPHRFAGWLVGIARNQCRDWLRQRARDRHEYVEQVPEVAADGNCNVEIHTLAELTAAVRSLPDRERLALHAFYLQGESAEAIRVVLGLSKAGIYRLLERARQRLARVLQDGREDVR
ncbi:MAG: sigma-70 family RNA polymerase sigma factor [Phycisphaerae bacterium]|nr:sigma-70 family RNA polymerase sigma factor [Phycisphaerae bacterium]